MLEKDILNRLINIAFNKSSIQHKHSACFISKNNKIIYGHNTEYKHAEELAVENLKKNINKDTKHNYDLYIIRINKSKKLLFSKPCLNCIHLLKKLTCIQNVFYTTDLGNFKKESILYLNNNHVSKNRKPKKKIK